VVAPVTPGTSTPAANQPTFSASVNGVVNDTATYTIDYTSELTLLWAANCTSTLNTKDSSCSAAPNLVVPNFTPSQDSVWVGSYTNATIGGYVTNGQNYYTTVCTESSSACQVMLVYVADQILDNLWNNNVQGAWGILGYGPRSQFWQSFINPAGLAYSSTVLLPAPFALGASFYDSNQITFGSLGSYNTYTTQPLKLTANILGAEPVYDIKTFGFGVTYTDNTAYYANFTDASVSAQFTPNFEGMGLPTKLYKQYETLVLNATSQSSTAAVCSNGTDG